GDQRAQGPAAAYGGADGGRVTGAAGVGDEHGGAGGEQQGHAEQDVLGVGRDGDGGHGVAAEPGDPDGVDDPGGDGGQQGEVDGVGQGDDPGAVRVHGGGPLGHGVRDAVPRFEVARLEVA